MTICLFVRQPNNRKKTLYKLLGFIEIVLLIGQFSLFLYFQFYFFMSKKREWIPCPLCKSQQHQEIITTPVMMQNLPGAFTFVRCQSCALVFLNPRVPVNELGGYYPENYFPYRGEKAWGKYGFLASIGLKAMDQKRVKIVRKVFPIQKDSQVLDVGCGTPTFLKALQNKTQCQAHGIDFNDRAWKNQKAYQKLHLYTGTIEDLAPHQSFDVITMWHYLEHDYDPQHTLKKLAQHSHPQSKLIIEVPNYDSWSRRKQGNHWGGYHSPRHTVLYTPQTLKEMLELSGWKVLKMQTYGTMDPFIVWWLGDMQRRNINWEESMEKRFLSLLFQKIITAPFFALERYLSLGILLAVASPKEN